MKQSKLPFAEEIRSPVALLASGLSVIDSAFAAGAELMVPLFSGGHDSLCACHVASQHPRFGGEVYHIDTGIGAKAARRFVESVCREQGWKLKVFRSEKETYEKFVRERGFPGPGRHHWIYVRIKDRCIRQMTAGRKRRALITGCRKEESTRRMGSVKPLKVGETSKSGKVTDKKRAWTAPCHDWSAAEQRVYMDEHDLPTNPLKERLGMSGECFCGAFAMPNEIELVKRYAPDVAAEIDRLAVIARECGTHDVWGTRPADEAKGLVMTRTGELCNGCDRRAMAAGLLFANC